MFEVTSTHVGGEIEVHQFVVKGPAIGNVGGRCRAYGENFQRAYPVEVELGLENGGVGAFLGPLADGCGGVVDPRPTADGDGGDRQRASIMGALRRLRRDTLMA